MSDFANNTASSFLAGGLSTALAMTCVAPLVTINARMMYDNPKIISSGNVVRYTGMVDCFTHIAREQGIKGFWRGNLINVIRFSPSHAFSFAFKGGIKGLFPKAEKSTEFTKFAMINMASGGLAGATSPLVIYPLDFARNRLVTDGASAQFNGLADCIKKTVASGGIQALYHGYGISVMGIIPYRAVYFGLFDTLSGYNPFQKDESNSKRTVSKLICAQTSAITATYISYPFDTVRRRLQMQSEKPTTNTGRLIYNGIYDCLIKVIRNEGAYALFKGVRRTGSNLHIVSAALALVFFSELTEAESS